jgi:hypothetical protein
MQRIANLSSTDLVLTAMRSGSLLLENNIKVFRTFFSGENRRNV